MAKAKTGKEKTTAEARASLAIRLRIEGKNFIDIGKRLGITPEGALAAYRRGLAALRPPQEAEELRSVEVTRLEALHESLWPHRKDPKVAGQIIKAIERRSKLLGLDAAIDVNLKGKIDYTKSIMDMSDEEQQALIAALGGTNGDASVPAS